MKSDSDGQTFKNHLYNVVSEIKDSSDSIQASGNELGDTAQKTTVSSDEINKAVEDMSKGAVAQAEDIESASKNVVDMGEIIEQIVTKVSNLDKTSSNMKTASDESTSIINELSKSNDKAHAENWGECYIEIIAKPAKKSVTPQKSEEAE
jgi:methyl-accepting chemotaxis protein